MATAELPRRWAWPGLAVVLAGGLGLRLWGVRQGLPFVYNIDEATHFVPRAVAMFGHDLNPHYFANPPAFTYVLHLLFAVWYGGAQGARHALQAHPASVYTLARVAAALLGAGALWLLYAAGARLFGRGVGLLAAAIEAVAFLPVFYAHLALNDVPTLAPLTLSLLGSAGVLRKGRLLDYLLAGAGLGLACASKYTAGIALVPLLAAAAARFVDGEPPRRTALGLALAGALAVGAFLLANPFALLDYGSFHRELVHQSTLSAEAQGKLGAPRHGGLVYYLWSLSWGLGWVPSLAALGGALTVWRRQRRLGWLLVPAAVLFGAFMGLQGRYFGRWLLPVFPILCLLGAHFLIELAGAGARLAGRLGQDGRRGAASVIAAGGSSSGAGAYERPAAPVARVALTFVVVVAALAQGAIYSVHSGLVLSRADTRQLTRRWLVANVPAGARVVVEPVAPDDWARLREPGSPGGQGPYRWRKYPSLVSRITPAGALGEAAQVPVGIEDYVRTLSPALIGYYVSHGYCWVIGGSTQSGRALADPAAAPLAIAYYRALAARAQVVYRASPYAPGQGPVAFGFDWSFDYYPLAYRRPGPQMTVYRLRGGRCAQA